MIYQFYILDFSGTALFRYTSSDAKGKLIDEQLISGFIFALTSFSERVFSKRFQHIEFPDRRLTLTSIQIPPEKDKTESEDYLIAVAFSDIIDDPEAVANISKRLLHKFFNDYYKPGHIRDEFIVEMEKELKDKTKSRTTRKLILGGILAFIFHMITAILYSALPSRIDAISVIVGFCLFIIAGYVIGASNAAIFDTTIAATISAYIFIILTDFFGIYMLSSDFTSRVIFIVTSALLSAFGSYIGGKLYEKRYLYSSVKNLNKIYRIKLPI